MDVYHIVKNCRLRIQIETKIRHQRHLERCPAAGRLEFVSIDVLEPLPRTNTGSQFVLIITDIYGILVRAIRTAKNISTQAMHFFHCYVTSYGLSNFILRRNGQQFVRKFFTSLCAYLVVMRLATIAFHLLTNGQVERYNKTCVAQLQLYISGK